MSLQTMRAIALVLACLSSTGYGSRIRSASEVSDQMEQTFPEVDQSGATRTLKPSQALALFFLTQKDPVAAFQAAGLSATHVPSRARGTPAVHMNEKMQYKVTVNALKAKCKTLGLKVSGSKAELIARLEEHPDGPASLQEHLLEQVAEQVAPTKKKEEQGAPTKKVKLSVDQSASDEAGAQASVDDIEWVDVSPDTDASMEPKLAPVPKHLPVTYIDAENVRGVTGFKLSYPELLAATSLWVSKNNLQGRVVIVVDHSAEHQGFYLPRHGLGVVFAGQNQKADDVLVRSVNFLATEHTRNSVLVTEDQGVLQRCLDMRADHFYSAKLLDSFFNTAQTVSWRNPSEQDAGNQHALNSDEMEYLDSAMSVLSEFKLRGRCDDEGWGGSHEDIERFRRYLAKSENEAVPDHALLPVEAYIEWINSEEGQAAVDEEASLSQEPAEGTTADSGKSTQYMAHINDRVISRGRATQQAVPGREDDRLLSVALGKKDKLGVALFDGLGRVLRYASYDCPAEVQREVLEHWLAGKLENNAGAIPFSNKVDMTCLDKRVHASPIGIVDRTGLPATLPVTHLVMEDFSGLKNHRDDEFAALTEARKKIDESSEMFVVTSRRWRHDLLKDTEMRTGTNQALAFKAIAKQVLNDRGPEGLELRDHNPQPNEDSSITMGYWATRQLGWVTQKPVVRRYVNGKIQDD
mmetsp:Transcript_42533/g.74688  ORF Transcript_42533/g.74688 Transcript_42533/m.74688 type:complete len:693 (+) Transcript_42533:54-2132(+)